MTLRNGLWFHEYNPNLTSTPKVSRLNDACMSNLWHGRLAHAGEDVTKEIHKHVLGINRPLKHNPLYKCPPCLPNKMSKASHKRKAKYRRQTKNVAPTLAPQIVAVDDPTNQEDCLTEGAAGQHFHMDFGFVRGSKYSVKQENAPTITSVDGYNSYLIIVDRVTRYVWVFLTTSKSPPITIAQKILNKFKCKNPHRTCRTDQGGKLGRSHKFQSMLVDENFIL